MQKKVVDPFDDKHIEYKSNGDESKTLSMEEYHKKLKWYHE